MGTGTGCQNHEEPDIPQWPGHIARILAIADPDDGMAKALRVRGRGVHDAELPWKNVSCA